MQISFETQPKPEGLAQAFSIGANFIANDSVALILGDNLFYGSSLGSSLKTHLNVEGAHIFTYQVSNPSSYGVLTLDKNNQPIAIEEKPVHPTSNQAVTGLYFFDNRVVEFASRVTPSARGELEITSVIEMYLQLKELSVTQLSRGTAWLDTGNADSLLDASTFVKLLQDRTGLRIGCIEELAWRNGWIDSNALSLLAKKLHSTDYGKYLETLLR